MPRPLRIEYPGALYHIMSRGERLGRAGHKHELARERGETDTQRAERLVSEWLSSTGWTETNLVRRTKGDAGKVELARLLRQHTPMSRQWIADRLRMGSASNVTKLTALSKSVEYENCRALSVSWRKVVSGRVGRVV